VLPPAENRPLPPPRRRRRRRRRPPPLERRWIGAAGGWT